MMLRPRLFVTSVLVAVPLAVAWFFVDTRVRLGAKEDELRTSVAADLAGGLRARCEADPPRSGRPGRGGNLLRVPPREAGERSAPTAAPGERPRRGAGQRALGPGGSGAYQFFAYDETGRPTSQDAPPLPADRNTTDVETYCTSAGLGVSLVVPLGGNGPCTYILARIPPRPAETRDQARALALVVVCVLTATWVAAGPLIGRLRRLAEAVRRSASSHYAEEVPVDGRDEVASLAGAFNEAGRQVRARLLEVQGREEALRDFVANTTHDVAIPLSVLQGHLANLERDLTGASELERVRQAIQEAHYMGSLLRNLGAATHLDVAQAPLSVTRVDLGRLVEHVIARHRPVATALAVDLNGAVPGDPLEIDTDSTLLEQALNNLVDNAIRYNHAGGHVAVVLDESDRGFILSVTDDGPGVSDEELERLTARWFRGSDARTRRPDGKGLGLAIARESCARLGLRLALSRPPDGGLRAEIRGDCQAAAGPPLGGMAPSGREA